MNKIQRTSSIKRKIRRIIFRLPEKKYVISGDRACRRMMQNARRHQQQKPDPEAASILAWARYEFTKELLCGFWEREAAYPVC